MREQNVEKQDHKEERSSEKFKNYSIGVAGVISSILIPLVIAYFTYTQKNKENDANSLLKDKEIAKSYIELGTKILSTTPDSSMSDTSLRSWAVVLINHYSEIKLPAQVKQDLITTPIYATESDFTKPRRPVDRASIKTTIQNVANMKKVLLTELLKLPLLDPKYNDRSYQNSLIPVVVNGGLKEGDIVSTEGFLRLASVEMDGDYFLQLTTNRFTPDSCFIVEIPNGEFVDAAIKESCEKSRKFIDKLSGNKAPSKSGSSFAEPPYIRVSGQLFYDAIHAKSARNQNKDKNSYRGKHRMHSYTEWEIHPATHIELISH